MQAMRLCARIWAAGWPRGGKGNIADVELLGGRANGIRSVDKWKTQLYFTSHVDCGLWTVGCGLWTVDCGLCAVGGGSFSQSRSLLWFARETARSSGPFLHASPHGTTGRCCLVLAVLRTLTVVKRARGLQRGMVAGNDTSFVDHTFAARQRDSTDTVPYRRILINRSNIVHTSHARLGWSSKRN